MRIPLLYLKIRNGFGGWSNTKSKDFLEEEKEIRELLK